MPVIFESMKLAYFPVPKVANTSIKHALHQASHGDPYTGEISEDGARIHIHKKYKTSFWKNSFIDETERFVRFCIVRDPVDRLLSTYRNRVVHYKELSTDKIKPEVFQEYGVSPDPSIDEFIANLETYWKVSSSVHIHAAPLVEYLGFNPDFYHLITNISGIDRVANLIAAMSGHNVRMKKRQMDGPKVDRSMLSGDSIEKINIVYEKDYRVFGRYF